jgi:hypothetical protein
MKNSTTLPPEIATAISRGLHVFPVQPQSTEPIFEDWQQKATNDPAQIAAWVREFPRSNWGAKCGADCGFFAVDVTDSDAMQALEDKYGPLSTGLRISAPMGEVLLFVWPEGIQIETRADCPCAGVAILGRGSFVVLPPSLPPPDHKYAYNDTALPIPECPARLLRSISAPVGEDPSPHRDGGSFHYPDGTREKLAADAETEVALVESAEDAEAVTAWAKRVNENRVALGMGGPGGWHHKKARRADVAVPVSDLNCANGRRVYILLNAHAQTNPDVREARTELIVELERGVRHARVKVCNLPKMENVNSPAELLAEWEDEALIDVFADARSPAEESINRPAGGTSAEQSKPEATATDGEDEYWPEQMDPDAFYGLAGDFVNLVSPQSEGDPQALLLTFLVGFGAMAGSGPYCQVEDTIHTLNEFCVIAGKTSKARKGTATNRAMRILARADAGFMEARRRSGLSSGEGLIQAVRDPREDDVEIKDKGKRRWERQVVDKGEADKRLLITESEFSSVLQQLCREGNTLSAVLRNAFDGMPIRVLARSNKDSCAKPHISLIGNITVEEVRRQLTTNEKANGFGNRILWCCAQRSKELPFGGDPLDPQKVETLVINIQCALKFAAEPRRMEFDEECRRVWPDIYHELSREESGIFGSMTARAEAHVLRLCSIYAVLDCCEAICLPHLTAAVAVWRYCANSVRAIFGDLLGDETADAILRMLRHAPDGLTQTEISNGFSRHKSAAELNRALSFLERQRKIFSEQVPGEGAPVTCWRLYAKKTSHPAK